MSQLAVTTNDPTLVSIAQELASNLNLPYSDKDESKHDYWLILDQSGLALVSNKNKRLKPLYIDFEIGSTEYRKQHTSLRKEPLARAIGIHPDKKPLIVDATAGFGQDSYLLACLGYNITMLERSPILFALLQDGLKRLTSPISQQLTLVRADSREWLPHCKPSPDIIYLDPMFPERKKSAAVKKNMAMLHELLDDSDEDDLLDVALACATYRVVVKRPRLSVNLAGKSPTYTITGPKIRYDIYQVQSL